MMGSAVEFNDTLKLKRGADFPADVAVGQAYHFERDGLRFFHPAPGRVFLVEEIAGQWNFRGHVHILEQTINSHSHMTTGTFVVTKLYSAEHSQLMNTHEAPAGKGYRPNEV